MKIGATSVETDVIVTDSATSPRARYETTFEDVPPGAQPTRITPAAISGGNVRDDEKRETDRSDER